MLQERGDVVTPITQQANDILVEQFPSRTQITFDGDPNRTLNR
jgi:hypothetical protein